MHIYTYIQFVVGSLQGNQREVRRRTDKRKRDLMHAVPHSDWFSYWCYNKKKNVWSFELNYAISKINSFPLVFLDFSSVYRRVSMRTNVACCTCMAQMWWSLYENKNFTNVLNAVLTCVYKIWERIFLNKNTIYIDIFPLDMHYTNWKWQYDILCVPDGIIWITGITKKKT